MAMKKFIAKICLLGAASIAVLLACNKESRDSNPRYNPDTEEVNASFVFNLSSFAKTKQAGTNLQIGDAGFRGITNAYLMSMTSENASTNFKDGVLIVDRDAERSYDLSTVLNAGVSGTRVLEMSLPLRTDNLIFYGKAPDGTGDGAYDEFGHLEKFDVSPIANKTNIQLGRRLSKSATDTWNKTNFRAVEKLMGGILTLIMRTTLDTKYGNHGRIDENDFAGDKKYGFTVEANEYPATITWKSYYSNTSPFDGAELRPLEDKLAYLYKQMTTIRTSQGELRAASGEAVIKIVQDLWSVINSVRCAEPTCKAEAVAKYFAQVVHDHIDKFFDATVDGSGTAVTGVKFSTIANIVSTFNKETDKTSTDPSIGYNLWPDDTEAEAEKPSGSELNALTNLSGPLTNFPFNFHIPRGAAYMAYNAKEFFYYPQEFNVSGMGGSQDQTTYNAENYYYPAELIYFGNSPIRVSSIEHKGGYPTINWEDDNSWSAGTATEPDWVGSKVISTTRSVAMKYNINYGVAMLKTSVQYAQSTIYDNRAAVLQMDDRSSTEGNQPIAVDATSFQLTGIIVGGQPQNIGWDCLPIKEEGKEKVTYGFVYDKAIPTDAMTIPAYPGISQPNYTVLFDSYNSTKGANEQDKIYVALEFKNNTQKDIYGNANIIKNGGYFYLIGVLDPTLDPSVSTNHVTGVNWPTTGSFIPPYSSSGRTNITRVFIQDFMTSATFTFGPNSLAGAYLTVPDLRSSSLTLGLSVDLNWQKGLIYTDVPLGGTN